MFGFGRIAPSALIGALLCAPTAEAASPAAKCQAAKLKIAAKYGMCQLTAHSKSVKAPVDGKLVLDLEKCAASFDKKWTRAEEKGGADCPTSGDAGPIGTAINHSTTEMTLVVRSERFVDNGDGTITDTRKGLMWEKKDSADGEVNFSNVHDVDNHYPWSSTGTLPDGRLFTEFLGQLNTCYASTLDGSGFAGHCDWRLPTQTELRELYPESLEALIHCSSGHPPCIVPELLPASFDDSGIPAYWTSLSYAQDPGRAVVISFGSLMETANLAKTSGQWVRAVRTIGGPFVTE